MGRRRREAQEAQEVSVPVPPAPLVGRIVGAAVEAKAFDPWSIGQPVDAVPVPAGFMSPARPAETKE